MGWLCLRKLIWDLLPVTSPVQWLPWAWWCTLHVTYPLRGLHLRVLSQQQVVFLWAEGAALNLVPAHVFLSGSFREMLHTSAARLLWM